MAISFNRIPSTIRVPGVLAEFSSERAVRGVQLKPYRALLIGQKLSAGSVAELTPTVLSSVAQATAYFGAGSQLAGMAEAWFANNAFTQLYAIAFNDPSGGAAAEGELAITGPASAPGSLYLLIAGRRVVVNVASAATATTIAAAVAAAINARTDLPVTATADTGTVTVVCRHDGTLGNSIDLRLNYYSGEELPAGVGVTITAMADGAGVVDLDDVWPVLGEEQFDVIAAPYLDAPNLTSIETELADRWEPPRMIEGIAFSATPAAHAAALTLGDSRNSRHLSIMSAFGSPTPFWEWAAAVAAVTAFYANIDPARPLQTLPLAWLKPAKIADRFSLSERNQLLYDGISTHVVAAGDVIRLERVITTYQENQFGAPDPSYLDVETPLTLGFLRYALRQRFMLRFPRHKLGDDDARFGPGQAVVTPQVARGEIIAWAGEMEALGLVEGIDAFTDALIVERNPTDPNRLDIDLPPDLVNQARLFAAKISFLL